MSSPFRRNSSAPELLELAKGGRSPAPRLSELTNIDESPERPVTPVSERGPSPASHNPQPDGSTGEDEELEALLTRKGKKCLRRLPEARRHSVLGLRSAEFPKRYQAYVEVYEWLQSTDVTDRTSAEQTKLLADVGMALGTTGLRQSHADMLGSDRGLRIAAARVFFQLVARCASNQALAIKAGAGGHRVNGFRVVVVGTRFQQMFRDQCREHQVHASMEGLQSFLAGLMGQSKQLKPRKRRKKATKKVKPQMWIFPAPPALAPGATNMDLPDPQQHVMGYAELGNVRKMANTTAPKPVPPAAPSPHDAAPPQHAAAADASGAQQDSGQRLLPADELPSPSPRYDSDGSAGEGMLALDEQEEQYLLGEPVGSLSPQRTAQARYLLTKTVAKLQRSLHIVEQKMHELHQAEAALASAPRPPPPSSAPPAGPATDSPAVDSPSDDEVTGTRSQLKHRVHPRTVRVYSEVAGRGTKSPGKHRPQRKYLKHRELLELLEHKARTFRLQLRHRARDLAMLKPELAPVDTGDLGATQMQMQHRRREHRRKLERMVAENKARIRAEKVARRRALAKRRQVEAAAAQKRREEAAQRRNDAVAAAEARTAQVKRREEAEARKAAEELRAATGMQSRRVAQRRQAKRAELKRKAAQVKAQRDEVELRKREKALREAIAAEEQRQKVIQHARQRIPTAQEKLARAQAYAELVQQQLGSPGRDGSPRAKGRGGRRRRRPASAARAPAAPTRPAPRAVARPASAARHRRKQVTQEMMDSVEARFGHVDRRLAVTMAQQLY